MKVKLKLKPGDRGTKKLVSLYGEKLVCVRYRYDEVNRKRMKTVEIIVEEIPWKPQPDTDTKVFFKVNWKERDLQAEVKKAGGIWDPVKQLWILSYGKLKELGLETRMVDL